MKTSTYLIVFFTIIARVSAVDCFFGNHLDFAYNLPDQSGNYTSSKEYWMRQDTICDFVLDTDSMLAWYSSDIKVYYMLYWDKDDGENCRASPNAEFKEYKKNTPFIMG